ncbi:hypothetical protein KIV56_00185 [Cryobacterium breve]|uniref:ATPase BadF/BadG/BcrA/BcrD type domain-containing protein n=1 Tax=Cryobacterium breve TaxID=1259258 RepID=A0ABY7NEV3_9MICO|nr:hypothetical protein KIV56_00185 [Cryobacterium breve]
MQDVFLAHDSVTSYLGALGDTPGAVIAVGTGVVTLAVGVGAVARVDGWGYLIADAGSGYWLGRAALDSVMRDYDGRGQVTALRNAVQKEFPNLETLYLEPASRPGPGEPDRGVVALGHRPRGNGCRRRGDLRRRGRRTRTVGAHRTRTGGPVGGRRTRDRRARRRAALTRDRDPIRARSPPGLAGRGHPLSHRERSRRRRAPAEPARHQRRPQPRRAFPRLTSAHPSRPSVRAQGCARAHFWPFKTRS